MFIFARRKNLAVDLCILRPPLQGIFVPAAAWGMVGDRVVAGSACSLPGSAVPRLRCSGYVLPLVIMVVFFGNKIDEIASEGLNEGCPQK